MSRKHIIMLGPPGVGKGTQAHLLVERYGFHQLSTGDILRSESEKDSDMANHIKKVIESGSLVDDKTILTLIRQRLQQIGTEQSVIFDGFPRTEKQAIGLDTILEELDQKLLLVIELVVDTNILWERIAGRLVCPSCGLGYHRVSQPPKKKGLCDRCGASLESRKDDDEETLKHRLAIFEKETMILRDHYQNQNILATFNGFADVDEIFQEIVATLAQRQKAFS